MTPMTLLASIRSIWVWCPRAGHVEDWGCLRQEQLLSCQGRNAGADTTEAREVRAVPLPSGGRRHESPEASSRRLAAVGSKDTAPELVVRRMLHAMGLRFRLHRRDLPGTPDVVLGRHRTVIFVSGCYWHRHPGCPFAQEPQRNSAFWQAKFARNVERDRENRRDLRRLGWRVIVVWECETRNVTKLRKRLERLFGEEVRR